jgi:hypothetical protein
MGWGDEILAAGQAQRLYEADPSRPVAICDQRGRVREHPIWQGNPAIASPALVRREVPVQRVTNAPGCRPYIVYPFTRETGWTFDQTFRARDYVARIYLTEAELRRGLHAHATYGPYVLIEPFTDHGNFLWHHQRWVALVEACPDLTFVQHVHADSVRVPGTHQERATFREACGLLLGARAYVRSESGLCHAAAALGVPTVTIWGGCMDAEVLGGYPLRVDIVDAGPGSPCGRWLRCQHCRDAMARLSVDEVASALRLALQMGAEVASC